MIPRYKSGMPKMGQTRLNLIGAAMLLRPRLTRWLQRRRPWKFTIFVNGAIMTLFLWHMTAYLLAILLLWPLGFGHQHDSTARWWIERPLWIAVPGLLTVALILLVYAGLSARHTEISYSE